jgi:predicted 3-demethylubiquinone-9 3-methyltransferase (glyoxalase superfamily)
MPGKQKITTLAISLLVNCDTQEEVDEFWSKLGAGGEEGPCGWLKDKFGLARIPRSRSGRWKRCSR